MLHSALDKACTVPMKNLGHKNFKDKVKYTLYRQYGQYEE
jgi:hypothetical protein